MRSARWHRAAGIVALATLTVVAPGQAGGSESTPDRPSATRTAPATAARDGVATRGAALYARACASCHGPDGRGDGPDAGLFVPRPRDLREGFLTRYPVDDLVRRIRAGTPLELALDLPALTAHAKDVEAIAAHLERLPGVDWRLVERGQEVYVDRCELCHGPFGRPGAALPPGVATPRDLSDPAFQRSVTDEDLATVVRHGRKGMPGLLPRLPESDTRPLVAFVRLLSPGFEDYSRFCAACHGDDGRGAGSFAEPTGLPTVAFDRAYFRRRDPEQVRSAVWHMLRAQKPSMPHFRTALSAADARAIIDHLRSLDRH